MAVSIEVFEVTDGFSTTLGAEEVEIAIGLVDQADECLDKNSVSDETARALKIYAARHILVLQSNSGRGVVSSESAPSGASRSYSRFTGPGGTAYFQLLKQLDRFGCVISVIENDHPMTFMSIGRECK